MISPAAILIAKRVLFFAIPIPVVAILAAWLWVTFDKHSAIRKAVDRAITELVDGAELEAERAKSKALETILAKRERDAETDRQALRRYAYLLDASETEKDNLADEIAELESRPVNDSCSVDQPLFDRLRQ